MTEQPEKLEACSIVLDLSGIEQHIEKMKAETSNPLDDILNETYINLDGEEL